MVVERLVPSPYECKCFFIWNGLDTHSMTICYSVTADDFIKYAETAADDLFFGVDSDNTESSEEEQEEVEEEEEESDDHDDGGDGVAGDGDYIPAVAQTQSRRMPARARSESSSDGAPSEKAETQANWWLFPAPKEAKKEDAQGMNHVGRMQCTCHFVTLMNFLDAALDPLGLSSFRLRMSICIPVT